MTQHLEREISKLKKKMLSLCALTEESVQMAVKSLEIRDDNLANEVVKRDLKIDQEEVELKRNA